MIYLQHFVMLLRKNFVPFLLLLTAFSARSQEKAIDSASRSKTAISVSLQPLFMVNNALKADLELQPSGRKFSYVLTAELYDGTIQKDDDFGSSKRLAHDQLNGFGLGILQKYKFKKKLSSPYVAYGATYRHQEVAIETEGYYTTQQDGLTFYEYGAVKKRLLFDGLLLSTTLGYQKVSYNFVCDVYFGIGYKAPFGDADSESHREYDDNMTSLTFKGIGMLVGFKLGYQF
jgi:hypothetical protein